MKMKKIFITIAILGGLLASCEKFEDINKNPNNVSETHPQLLLTAIEWSAFQVEGASPLFASRMIVQTDGEEPEQYYKWDRSNFDEYNSLRNVTKMMEEAVRIENNSYQALAKFFRAYYFYNLTLRFGDVPYSAALQGENGSVYEPVYDPQKQVFQGILNELKEADELLTDDLIEGDIIYGGDPSKWRKLINSFRLKVLLTLSGKTSETDLAIIETFAQIVSSKELLESNSDNGQVEFINQDGNRYTEYNSSSYGSARYMDSTFIKRLQDRKDPRLFIFAGQTRVAKEAGLEINDFAAYEGGNPIAAYNDVNLKAADGKVSKVNLRYTADPTNEPHMILGYAELQFILSEARVRGWITASDAKTYYENGIKASFEFYNSYSDEYAEYVNSDAAVTYLGENLVAFDNANSDEERIERIITQKYLQSFLQGGWSAYYENLRTGYPGFASLPGLTPPTRYMYPNNEYLLNADHVAEAITRQFGAGNDKTREITWWLK